MVMSQFIFVIFLSGSEHMFVLFVYISIAVVDLVNKRKGLESD